MQKGSLQKRVCSLEGALELLQPLESLEDGPSLFDFLRIGDGSSQTKLFQTWFFSEKEKTNKQRTHKGIWWSVCLGSVCVCVCVCVCVRDGLGANPRTSGMSLPHLRVILHRLGRMSAGQTGHFFGTDTGPVHGMVAVQKWGCPAEFLYVYWVFFVSPK